MAAHPIHPMKVCTKCRLEKPATNEFFHKNGKRSRLCPRCIECRRLWFRENAARFKKWNKAHYEANKAARLQAGKLWRDSNKDRYQFYQARRLAEHPERERDRQRAWKARNRGRINASNRERRRQHPEIARQHGHFHRARRRGALGKFTADDLKGIFERQGGKCFYCDSSLDDWEVEHFVPLVKGGTNFPDNICIACRPCNAAKGALLPWEWKPDRFSENSKPRP